MPSNQSRLLITSKNRLKLLSLFFLNQNLSVYFQGLSKELCENTNSIRAGLNRIEESGLHSVEEQVIRKVSSVNRPHKYTTYLSNMFRKVTGIDHLIYSVVSHCRHFATSVDCGRIGDGHQQRKAEETLAREAIHSDCLGDMMSKVETVIEKAITWQVSNSSTEVVRETAFLSDKFLTK